MRPHRAATYKRIGDTRYRWEFRRLEGSRRWEFRRLEGESAADYEIDGVPFPLIGPWVQGVAQHELKLVRVAEHSFRAQIADRWRDRNVFLLGDAAHLTPPFIGQGLCAGLRDAMNLSWKLTGVLSEDLPESVLDSYETERKPHARAMIKLAKLIGAAMTQGGPVRRRAQKAGRTSAAPAPGPARPHPRQRDPPLHKSLERRPRNTRSLAGRLCPNASLGDGRRLDDLALTGLLLVTTESPTADQRQRLVERGTRLVKVDRASELGTWLSKGHAVAALVRPDHTVMQAGRDLAAQSLAAPRFFPL